VERQEQDLGNRKFGDYLRRVRESRRLSLDAVEEMSVGFPERVTKSHLSRIENGLAYPTFTRLFALSRIYGVPIASIAERFDLALQREMAPPEAAARTGPETLEGGRKLIVAGRYVEALSLFSLALDRREDGVRGDPEPRETLDLRLFYVDCLVHLARYEFAKSEAEEILSHPVLSDAQRLMALQLFVICCYRLGRYTVAMMALEEVERRKASAEAPPEVWAAMEAIRGNVLQALGRVQESLAAHRKALDLYDKASVPFEACRARINLGGALMEAGDADAARRCLEDGLQEAESAGYDRLRAVALSLLVILAFLAGDHVAAEAYALRSNAIARPREYLPIVFRNCYYLWKIAQSRNDEAGVKTNERTLRAYVGRIEEQMPEVEAFRSHVSGGEA
jgi:tetratricopeptide (TPR) repeat protein